MARAKSRRELSARTQYAVPSVSQPLEWAARHNGNRTIGAPALQRAWDMSQPKGQIPASHRSRTAAPGIIVGLALQSLALVHGVPAWAQAGLPASEPQRPAYQIGSAGRFNDAKHQPKPGQFIATLRRQSRVER
jgi:hypothetical protein